ncbi:hypothetical protein GQ42DRAFT_162106 [Ramicandelaber brevisporus]|nr:hypothetical protein GQ42DRAFT_162106 [Ramicandelaber brevisporus]
MSASRQKATSVRNGHQTAIKAVKADCGGCAKQPRSSSARCDRELPRCTSCAIAGVACIYPSIQTPKTITQEASLTLIPDGESLQLKADGYRHRNVHNDLMAMDGGPIEFKQRKRIKLDDVKPLAEHGRSRKYIRNNHMAFLNKSHVEANSYPLFPHHLHPVSSSHVDGRFARQEGDESKPKRKGVKNQTIRAPLCVVNELFREAFVMDESQLPSDELLNSIWRDSCSIFDNVYSKEAKKDALPVELGRLNHFTRAFNPLRRDRLDYRLTGLSLLATGILMEEYLDYLVNADENEMPAELSPYKSDSLYAIRRNDTGYNNIQELIKEQVERFGGYHIHARWVARLKVLAGRARQSKTMSNKEEDEEDEEDDDEDDEGNEGEVVDIKSEDESD